MIICDSTQFPLVRIGFRASDWDKGVYRSFIEKMQQLLISAALNNTPIKFLIEGNPDPLIKQSIPYAFYAWIICDIIRMKPLFINGLEKTALFTPDDNLNFFLDMLFKVYTPARPLQRFYCMEQALNYLST